MRLLKPGQSSGSRPLSFVLRLYQLKENIEANNTTVHYYVANIKKLKFLSGTYCDQRLSSIRSARTRYKNTAYDPCACSASRLRACVRAQDVTYQRADAVLRSTHPPSHHNR